MSTYGDFLAGKERTAGAVGRRVADADVNPFLHPWQRRVVEWAVGRGRAALWEDTGLGKTVQEIEFARLSGARSLIIAPLAVCAQTVREAAKLGVDCRYVRSDEDAAGPGIWITNYEMATRFDAAALDAVVLDEASILKQSDGKTRTALIRHFAPTGARLTATATPAPNDMEELTNQAEFLGITSRAEMLAAYFVHDDEGWRLKGHARGPMFRWMASWAVALSRPSDIGGSDDGYLLPGLDIIPHLLEVDVVPEGQLFATDLGGVGGRAQIRKATLIPRCDKVIELVNASHELAAPSSKLAACHGSRNTTHSAESDTQTIPDTASVTASSQNGDGIQRQTAPTCGSTTQTTASDSPSTGETPQSGNAGTSDGGNFTRLTPSTARRPRQVPDPGIRRLSGRVGSAVSTASDPRSSMPSLPGSMEAALSAAQPSGTVQAGDSPSITATTPGQSGESSALDAISASGSSGMTLSSCAAPQATSRAKPEPWVIWCGLNAEQEYLERAFGDRAISVTGNLSPEEKVTRLTSWLDGDRPVLLSKPSILGFGINMQNCATMAFVGLSDSWESYYQCIRRCYRYGQTRRVLVHIVLSELESKIAENVARKEKHAAGVTQELVAAMRAAGELRIQ